MFDGILEKIAKASMVEMFGSIERITTAYFNKEISEEQYEADKQRIYAKYHEQAIPLLMEMVKSKDPYVRWAYPTAFWSTLFVQIWYSFIQPFGHAMWPGTFPILRPGELVEWNYLLLLGIIGLHPAGVMQSVGKFLKKD